MLQALAHGEKLEKQEAHQRELPIALSTAVYANSQRTKPPYATYSDYCFFKPPETLIHSDVCDCFFALSREEVLPFWALAVAPVDELRKNQKNQPVQKPRAWMCRGLLLLLPRVKDNFVEIAMAIADEDAPRGAVTLWDIDSDEPHLILVPEELENTAITEVTWLILPSC